MNLKYVINKYGTWDNATEVFITRKVYIYRDSNGSNLKVVI